MNSQVELRFKGQVKVSDWLKIAFQNMFISFISFVLFLSIGIYIVSIFRDDNSYACIVCQILVPSLVIWFGIMTLMFLLALYHLKSSKAFEPISGVISEEGIQVIHTQFQSTFFWNGIHKYKKYSNTLLLYTSSTNFQIMPKHLFKNDAEWKSFLELVNIHVSKKIL